MKNILIFILFLCLSTTTKAHWSDLYFSEKHSVPAFDIGSSEILYNVELTDSIFYVGNVGDTLYLIKPDYSVIPNLPYFSLHRVLLKDCLLDSSFRKSYDTYKDSLMQNIVYDGDINFFYDANNKLINKYRKVAPYGYVNDLGYSANFTFDFWINYTNLNKKTIKYLKIYFSCYNPVGDYICGTSVNGIGPVEYLNSASWDFDNIYFPNTSTIEYIKITKLVITYMDNSKITLIKNMRFFTADNK